MSILFEFVHRYNDGQSDAELSHPSRHANGGAAIAAARRQVRSSIIATIAIDIYYSKQDYDVSREDRFVGTVARDDENLNTYFKKGPAYVAPAERGAA